MSSYKRKTKLRLSDWTPSAIRKGYEVRKVNGKLEYRVNTRLEFGLVSSVGLGERVYVACPVHQTVCSIVLRHNGVVEWACGTLDCGWTLPFNSEHCRKAREVRDGKSK